MFGNLGSAEIIIIAIVILLLFGSNKLKELAGGLGESAKEFRKIKKALEESNIDQPETKSRKGK